MSAGQPSGPCRWCLGDPPVQTGNIRVYPVVWDNNVCHTYWYVYSGQGNVAHNIFGRHPTGAASTSAEPHSAPSSGVVLGPLHPDDVVPKRVTNRS